MDKELDKALHDALRTTTKLVRKGSMSASNGVLCGLNLKAETAREFLPICTRFNQLMHEGNLMEIDNLIRAIMQEETSVLVKLGTLRVTLCVKKGLLNWEPARDLFAETLPDAKTLMHGLYAT